MDPELQRLFYKRSRAKYKVDLDIENITPLLVAGLELTGGAWRIDFYMNEQPCKKYALYDDPPLYFCSLNFQPIDDLTS